jgi:hypothetical protein
MVIPYEPPLDLPPLNLLAAWDDVCVRDLPASAQAAVTDRECSADDLLAALVTQDAFREGCADFVQRLRAALTRAHGSPPRARIRGNPDARRASP